MSKPFMCDCPLYLWHIHDVLTIGIICGIRSFMPLVYLYYARLDRQKYGNDILPSFLQIPSLLSPQLTHRFQAMYEMCTDLFGQSMTISTLIF